MKDGFVGSGWIELIAVDGDWKKWCHWRYFKHSHCQVVIDLRSTLNLFCHFEIARVDITSLDLY